MYGVAHATRRGTYDLHDLAHAFSVGSGLHKYRANTTFITAEIACAVDDLYDLYDIYDLYDMYDLYDLDRDQSEVCNQCCQIAHVDSTCGHGLTVHNSEVKTSIRTFFHFLMANGRRLHLF